MAEIRLQIPDEVIANFQEKLGDRTKPTDQTDRTDQTPMELA